MTASTAAAAPTLIEDRYVVGSVMFSVAASYTENRGAGYRLQTGRLYLPTARHMLKRLAQFMQDDGDEVFVGSQLEDSVRCDVAPITTSTWSRYPTIIPRCRRGAEQN